MSSAPAFPRCAPEPEDREAVIDGALRIDDAVKWSGLGRTALYQYMQAGELAYFHAGRRRLIPRRALVDLLARLHGRAQ